MTNNMTIPNMNVYIYVMKVNFLPISVFQRIDFEKF